MYAHGTATTNRAVNNGNCADFTVHTDAAALQTHFNKGMTGTRCWETISHCLPLVPQMGQHSPSSAQHQMLGYEVWWDSQ